MQGARSRSLEYIEADIDGGKPPVDFLYSKINNDEIMKYVLVPNLKT